MFDSGKIIIGLILFLGIFTFPLWYNAFGGAVEKKPDIILPAKSKVNECVNTTDYMRTSHMNLLNEWRDQVVRKGDMIYTSPAGGKFKMSLSKTCLGCHSDKSKFCDRCHGYLGVNPYCWECHVDPKNQENK